MQYLYSQSDKRWKDIRLIDANSLSTMQNWGCVVTDCCMMLADFYKRDVLPTELLPWLKRNNGFDTNPQSPSYGGIYWQKIVYFTGGKLKFGNAATPSESTYAIRQVFLGRINHWILKGPSDGTQIRDPLDGSMKDERAYKYTGTMRVFSGIPVIGKEYHVDYRYSAKYNPIGEARFKIPLPFTPALTIKNRIGRLPSQREVNGLLYGAWDFEAIFKGRVGNDWLYSTKGEWLKERGLV